MKQKFTTLVLGLVLFSFFSLSAQEMVFKTAYNFPVYAQDSILSGLKSCRNVQYHPDPLGDGVAAFAATNYYEGGVVSVFKCAGDDAIELVYTTPPFDSLGGYSTPRYVQWGDLDNDGVIELIFQNNRNGVAIFEWDGVPGSWNFGDAPARVIGPPDIPTDYDAFTEYIDTIQDLDGDGDNELLLAINSANPGNVDDCFYIFSIIGQYETGNPGFSAVKSEARYSKGELPYALYGGGTPWVAMAANFDGAGNKEMLFHNWNYGQVTTVRITGHDTYELAEETNEKRYYYSCVKPHDNVCYMGAFVYDIDKDGREEAYLPFFYNDNRPFPGVVGMVYYDEGSNTAEIDSSNVVLFDISEASKGDNIFGYGYGDYDGDGKPNLYFSGGYGKLVVTAEFQGGDKTDQANWTLENLYKGDSTIYTDMTIWDSVGVVDTTRTVDISFVSKFAARHSDFDKDGYEDMILSFQAMADSIEVAYNTWNADSGKYLVETYNIVNPKRWAIRMLESTVPTGMEAKDITVITPDQYILKQNYPNPFNPTTKIEFYLPLNKNISLTIYNNLGQKVKTLIDNQPVGCGTHIREWDGTNDSGIKVASGMYIYELKFGNFKKQKRMIFMK